MKKILLIIILLVCYGSIHSIDFKYGSRKNIKETAKDTQTLQYHTNTDDFHFYGTHLWGVQFDIKKIITNAESDSFLVSGTRIYFPQTNDSPLSIDNVKVYLYQDTDNHPGNLLYHNSTNLLTLNPSWNNIDFNTSHYIKKAWVVFEFQTSETGPFMAASQGTGQYSFYYDKYNDTEGIFVSLKDLGYYADFLIDLKGNFSKPLMVINIEEFNILEYLNPGEIIKPTFTLKNNSNLPANDVYFKIQLLNEAADVNISDSIYVTQSLNIGETISITDSYDGLTLPELFAQYSIKIQSGCNPNENSLYEQKIIKDINVFRNIKEKPLIEIFADTREITNLSIIHSINETYNSDHQDIIYYFPNNIDPLYTWGAYQRATQFLQLGTQHTYFNGNKDITQYNDSYLDAFTENLSLSTADKTFLSRNELEITILENNLEIFFTITNEDTYILQNHNQTTSNKRDLIFNAAILQNRQFQDNNFTILSQFITNPYEGVPLSLDFGEIEELNLNFPFYSISLIDENEFNDLSILTWIYDKFSKKIYYHQITSLENLNFDSEINPDENISNPVESYPNPIKTNSKLSLNIKNTQILNDLNIFLYNIKGQKIHKLNILNKTSTNNINTITIENLDKHKQLTSGIYFLKINWNDENNNSKNQIKKILFVK
jgi:hypothetical protein